MARNKQKSHGKKIIPESGDLVKGRIVLAGIPMRRLAKEAGISSGTLSNYLAGRHSFLKTQMEIYFAFRRLSGSEISLADFWGELLSKRIAG